MRTNQRNKSYLWALSSVLFFAFIVTACSSQMPEYIGKADTSVSMARANDAPEYAPAEFATAEDELQWSKGYNNLGRWTDSKYQAEKATIDAEVASATADYVQLNRHVDSLQQEVDQLHQQMEK